MITPVLFKQFEAEDRDPEPALFPDGPAARARCRRLEAWADEVVFPHLWDLIEGAFYPVPGGTGQGAGPEAKEIARLKV